MSNDDMLFSTLLLKHGISEDLIPSLINATAEELKRQGKVAADGKILCTESEFADIVVENIPKIEMERLAKKEV